METKTYFLHPEKKVLKQGFIMEDESKLVVYEAKMLKQPLFGPMIFEFVNHRTGQTAEHKVGKTVTLQQSGLLEFFTTKSSFKYDGENIWDYLHGLGIRIQSGLSHNKIGMTYDVSLQGRHIATIATAAPNGGKSIVTGGSWYNVTAAEQDLDLAFLTAFAFARCEQVIYD